MTQALYAHMNNKKKRKKKKDRCCICARQIRVNILIYNYVDCSVKYCNDMVCLGTVLHQAKFPRLHPNQ
jgi:hypothetical protein